MEHEPTFYLLKHRLPPSESHNLLGRIIARYQDPTFDYTPECPSTALRNADHQFTDFLLPPQHNHRARLTAQNTDSSTYHLKFLTLLSQSSSIAETTTVTSPCITTRRLKREREYFAALKSIPSARRKMLEMCPVGRGVVYLVVGTMSLQTGRFERSAFVERGRNVGVAVPVGMVAAAAAGVPLPGVGEMLPDVEAGMRRAGSTGSAGSFETASGDDEGGEEVFAVACKIVRRTWSGLGGDVSVRGRQPEYRGGQHFGESDGESDVLSNEGELDEKEEAALAEGFELGDIERDAKGDQVRVVNLFDNTSGTGGV